MRFSGPKALALTLLVSLGQVVPGLSGTVPSVAAAGVIPGSTQFVSVAPARLADTRPDQGAFGFTQIT
ncbi:MAG TPA: hypothetical protein VFE69_10865, partial [Ilumatobacteraceae bacterium]|nr:hypothetical protein [Ilumatobacteraceae bacterium]